MNKCIKVILVIVALCRAQYGHGMQRVPSVLSRSFYKNNEMHEHLHPAVQKSIHLGTHQEIAQVWSRQPFMQTVSLFNTMKEAEQHEQLNHLTELQQFGLLASKKGNYDAQHHVLTALFDGNEQVAEIFHGEPLEQTMVRYAQARDLQSKYPIWGNDRPFGAEYYMLLTEKEAGIFSRIIQDSIYYDEAEADIFVSACKKILMVNPELKCWRKQTSKIKLYPSLNQRLYAFYNASGDDTFPLAAGRYLGTGLGIIYGCVIYALMSDRMASLKKHMRAGHSLEIINEDLGKYDYAQNVFKFGISASFGIAGLSTIAFLFRKYPNYKNDLKNNVLPNQPSLTDFLHKRAVQTEQSKKF